MNKPPEKQTTPSLKTIAEALGVSVRRVSQLHAGGMPTDSVESALSYRARKSTEGTISTDRLRAERFRLIAAQAAKVETENAKIRGELIPAADAHASGMAIGYAMKSLLLGMLNNLPPVLAGLDEIGIFKVLKKEFYGMLDDMHRQRFFDSPEIDRMIEDFHNARPEPWAAPTKTKP